MSRTKIILWAFVVAMTLGFFALLAMQSGCNTVYGVGTDIRTMSRPYVERDK